MSVYLVMKRMRYQGVDYMPSAQLIDPTDAVVLMQRGYLVLVPDNFNLPPAPVSRAQASDSAGSGAGPADDENQITDPLPTVEQALEAGYSQEVAETLAKGEWTELAEAETKVLEEAAGLRPEAISLAKILDSSLAEIMALSNEDYEEAVKAFGVTQTSIGTEPASIEA